MPALARLAALPTRSLIAILSAALLLLVVLASMPALLLDPFLTPGAGGERGDSLIRQITAWTRTLLTPSAGHPVPGGTAAERDEAGQG
ncbi:hypothetical protein ACFC1R_34420 [Kitasatospora sp. NPDC056138]|uniref:hypothetical protein n=1 Tax=Kitasatospora sp. NPDC056138 TaxID=3345724 RepID=UPI0035E0F570